MNHVIILAEVQIAGGLGKMKKNYKYGKIDNVVIYTEGSCPVSNPGPGGYGVLIMHNGHRDEFSGGFSMTTSNRMELTGAMIGLRVLRKPSRVRVYSDSMYLINGIQKNWAKHWRSHGWRKKDGSKAQNPDLWEMLLDLCRFHVQVEFRWIRGHAGHQENELCDKLAGKAAAVPNLTPDPGFESNRRIVLYNLQLVKPKPSGIDAPFALNTVPSDISQGTMDSGASQQDNA